MDKVKTQLNNLSEKMLNMPDLEEVEALKGVAKKLGIKVQSIVFLVACVLCAAIVYGLAGDAVLLFIGFLYPTYGSFKAIKSKKDEHIE